VHHLSVDDDFAREELIGGEVDFSAVGQPIPVVVPDFLTVEVDLAENQVAPGRSWITSAVIPHWARAGLSGRH
jgi:hypothetical protein